MSADVRIEIKDYKREPAPMEDEVVLIMLNIACDSAEDTLIRL